MGRVLLRIVCGLVLLGAPVSADEIPVGRGVGERFPAVRLPALANARMTSLASFRGRKVLLFEFASW